MWISLDLAYAGISAFLTYLFVQAFLQKKSGMHIVWKQSTLFVVIIAKFFAAYLFGENIIVIPAVSFVSAVAIGMVCFQDKKRGVITASFFQLLNGASAELVATFIIITFQEVAVSELVHHNIYRLQARTLSYLVYLVVVILVSRFRNVRIDGMSIKPMLALSTLPLVSILVVRQFVVHVIAYTYAATIREIIPLVSILVVNIFIFILVENIMSQTEKRRALMLIEAQSSALEFRVKQLMDTHEQVTKMSHDYKHRVTALLILCEEKRYDELFVAFRRYPQRHIKRCLLIQTIPC